MKPNSNVVVELLSSNKRVVEVQKFEQVLSRILKTNDDRGFSFLSCRYLVDFAPHTELV